MEPQAIIPRFDAFLHARQLQFEGVILGGAALVLLKVITRETQDCDVLEPSLPEDIAAASREFAAEQRSLGHEVKDNWSYKRRSLGLRIEMQTLSGRSMCTMS